MIEKIGSPFDKEIVEKIKDLAAHNKPYKKVSVVVGVEGIRKVVYQDIVLFSGRENILLKYTKSQALDFLARRYKYALIPIIETTPRPILKSA